MYFEKLKQNRDVISSARHTEDNHKKNKENMADKFIHFRKNTAAAARCSFRIQASKQEGRRPPFSFESCESLDIQMTMELCKSWDVVNETT